MSPKEVTKQEVSRFFLLFLLDDRRLIEGSGSGSTPLSKGSGSGRPKNMLILWIRIRIRIRNTSNQKSTLLSFRLAADSA
jgi:hypothetical protein